MLTPGLILTMIIAAATQAIKNVFQIAFYWDRLDISLPKVNLKGFQFADLNPFKSSKGEEMEEERGGRTEGSPAAGNRSQPSTVRTSTTRSGVSNVNATGINNVGGGQGNTSRAGSTGKTGGTASNKGPNANI